MSKANTNPGFIEVIGDAKYKLMPSAYKLRLSVTFKTGFSKLDVKSSVLSKETETVLKNVVDCLIDKGFPEDQISFEGTQDFHRWRHKGYDTLRSNSLVLRSTEYKQIIKVPFWLENMNTGKHKINFAALQPIYEPDADRKNQAMVEAFDKAKTLAGLLAKQSGRKLGPALVIQDKRLHKGGGRDDYFGGAAGGAVMMGAYDDGGGRTGIEDYDLEEPSEEMSVALRIKFAMS